MLGNVLSNFLCFNFWKIERIWSIAMMHGVRDTHLQLDKSAAPQNHIFCSRAGFMSLYRYRGDQFSGWNGRSAPHPASLLLPPASSPRLPWTFKMLISFWPTRSTCIIRKWLVPLGGLLSSLKPVYYINMSFWLGTVCPSISGLDLNLLVSEFNTHFCGQYKFAFECKYLDTYTSLIRLSF